MIILHWKSMLKPCGYFYAYLALYLCVILAKKAKNYSFAIKLAILISWEVLSVYSQLIHYSITVEFKLFSQSVIIFYT